MKQTQLDTVTIDTERIFFNGGSHSGFIGAHMISKYPVSIYFFITLFINIVDEE